MNDESMKRVIYLFKDFYLKVKILLFRSNVGRKTSSCGFVVVILNVGQLIYVELQSPRWVGQEGNSSHS